MFTIKSNMEVRAVLSALNQKIQRLPHYPHKITRALRDSILAYLTELDRQEEYRRWKVNASEGEYQRTGCKADCCPPCCCVQNCKERR